MFIPKEYQEKSLLIYQGVLTVNLISILGNHIRVLPDHDPLLLQRIFKIFIELAQNVSSYSGETVEIKNDIFCGTGWVSVQNLSSCYRISTGNPIKPEHGPKLEHYCHEINSKDEESLRILKRKTRAQAMIRDINAHIGLIQTGIISGSKLEFRVTDDDRFGKFFTISAEVLKEPA
jgi:hypothetical protein